MQMKYDRCPNCMQALQQNEDTCPYCNFEVSQYEEKKNCLRPFTVLQNKYMIGRVIGVGGFGITYIGWDLNLQTYIAIKEYFPESIASRDTTGGQEITTVIPNETKQEIYDKGLKRYVEEAQNLSKFYQLQGIVSVKDFFYENGTGYIVMEYINGINLKEYLNNCGGRLDENTVLTLMKPVLESLYQIHNAGLVHRDISPDNIMVDNEGKIKLIDFGSARGKSAETDKTYTVILKHGYAPSEQYYAKGHQGPWTDIYSLCATMYKMLTGQIPPNSVERMEYDEYVAPSACGAAVSPRTEAVLAKGLAVKAADRYQNIGQLLNDLYGTQPVGMAGQGMPIPASESYANPASLSQQSMHLNVPQNNQNTASGNNKKIIYISIAAVAVVAIIALILIFGGNKDKDKDDNKTTEAVTTEDVSSTDDTTEEPDTEAPTTEEATPGDGAASYVWPTVLSDDWRDYTISIDGTIYQFPMPYSEWESKGWKANNLATDIAAGDYDYTTFYTERLELTAVVANLGLNEAPVDECFVVGISVGRYDEISDDVVIELPGGIKLGVSGEEDIKQAFGAPEYRYEGTDIDDIPYISLDYAGDNSMDGMDFEMNEAEKLYSISLINTNLPEGMTADSSQIDAEPPAINELYTAPEGPSTDRMDNIITLDGVNYVLPVTVSELTANGWALDTATDEYITGNSYTHTYMEKSGNKIYVKLENYTANAILPVNAYISGIDAEVDYCNLEIIFPGGIKLGDQGSKFNEMYSDLGEDYSEKEYSSFIAYDIFYSTDNGYISVSAYADPETKEITEYSYSNNVDDIR